MASVTDAASRPPLPIVLVVAIAENGVIGVGGNLPWRLQSDLRRFRAVTMGKPVVMGRKTFQSIGRPLDGRDNIVVSAWAGYAPPGVHVARSIGAALQIAKRCAEERGAPEICVIGGGQVFAETMPLATKMLVTHVHAEPEGDVAFPEISRHDWREISREALLRAPGDTADATFVTYERRPG